MTRQQMFYYITKNGVLLDPCNMQSESNGSIYWCTDSELKIIVNDIINELKEKARQQEKENSEKILPGDKISALGEKAIVDKIIYQDFFGYKRAAAPGSDCFGFDIEFIDTKGNYRHWKQNQDGGNVARWNGRTWKELN